MKKCFQCGTQCRKGYMYHDTFICDECLDTYYEYNHYDIMCDIEENSPKYATWYLDDVDLLFVEWHTNYLTRVFLDKEME